MQAQCIIKYMYIHKIYNPQALMTGLEFSFNPSVPYCRDVRGFSGGPWYQETPVSRTDRCTIWRNGADVVYLFVYLFICLYIYLFACVAWTYFWLEYYNIAYYNKLPVIIGNYNIASNCDFLPRTDSNWINNNSAHASNCLQLNPIWCRATHAKTLQRKWYFNASH